MDVVELRSETYRASVVPEAGALVSSLQYKHQGQWVDLLRPDPGGSGKIDGLPLFGSFPMVPFANRLSEPWLPAGDGRREVPVNWPAEGLAMHGMGFMVPWSAEAGPETDLQLSVDILDSTGQPLGTARQSITLEDNGFLATMTFQNHCDCALHAGLGFHPWIYAPGGEPHTKIRFAAKGEFVMNQTNLPTDHANCAKEMTNLDWSDAGLDTCFSDWSGSAEIHRPEQDLAVHLQSTSTNLHCFVAKDFDAICLEPVSHAPDAAHNPVASNVAPMANLAPGDEISVDMRIVGRLLSRSRRPRKGLCCKF